MSGYTNKQVGDRGEDYGVEYLKRRGYAILHRNYRKPFGEIDIVAKKNGVICFVEVKTRRPNPMMLPCEAVTRRKQQRLILAAQAYLAEHMIEAYCRFDVCEVIVDPNSLKLIGIRHIENAFEVS